MNATDPTGQIAYRAHPDRHIPAMLTIYRRLWPAYLKAYTTRMSAAEKVDHRVPLDGPEPSAALIGVELMD